MFKNIFNKFKSTNKDEILKKEEFEKACKRFSNYYYQQEIVMDLKHPETEKPMMFADSFPDEFNEWLSIRSSYDKKSVIFRVLDNYFWNSLPLWKLMDRLIEDRMIKEAFDLYELNKNTEKDDEDRFNLTIAKLFLITGQYEQSKSFIDQIPPKDSIERDLNVFLVDYFYHINNHKDLHLIFDQLFKDINSTDNLEEAFENMFSKVNGKLRSIYAVIQFGKSLDGKESENKFWDLAEEEFYWSSTFRKEYAYVLMKKGEGLRSFAKLLALVKEMPWDKEAALNSMEIMKSISYDGEEKIWLENLIEQNGWTSEDMTTISSFNVKF